jgi:hypothetical protein
MKMITPAPLAFIPGITWRAKQRTICVDAPRLLELIGRDCFDVSEHPRSRIVKQRVDFAELAPDARKRAFDRHGIADVALETTSRGQFVFDGRERE